MQRVVGDDASSASHSVMRRAEDASDASESVMQRAGDDDATSMSESVMQLVEDDGSAVSSSGTGGKHSNVPKELRGLGRAQGSVATLGNAMSQQQFSNQVRSTANLATGQF